MSRIAVCIAFAWFGLASSAVAASPADPVIAAERAFAARAQVVPPKAAFLEFVSPDAVSVNGDGAANARTAIQAWPDRNNPGFIKWWPELVGIAWSGDLGFTTGPAVIGDNRAFTNFFTVWRRQADGSWRWVIDMGASAKGPYAPSSAAPMRVVAVSIAPALPPERALAAMNAADDALARAVASSTPLHARWLAPDARILGLEDGPVNGSAAIAQALGKRPPSITLVRLGGGVSAAGDLGYTYGRASWRKGETTQKGVFLRVWQRRGSRWVVLVDNITEA